MELWAPADPTENGDWVSARIRVTNVGRTPIKVSGYPDNLACQSPVASWIDLTGLWDAGRTWEGNAEAFRRAYLAEGPSIIDVEVMPDGSEAACLDIGRPDGKLAAGASFEVPLATWVRYLWRDQPLPSGTAELVSTFRFNRPSRQPGQRRASIELRVPLEIAGADVSYPSPQELVDTALDQPGFLAWIETRRFDKSWNPSSHRLAEGFGQSEFAGGPAPMDTIQVGAFADGLVPENWGRVTIDPWDGSVRAVDITG